MYVYALLASSIRGTDSVDSSTPLPKAESLLLHLGTTTRALLSMYILHRRQEASRCIDMRKQPIFTRRMLETVR